MTETQKRIIKKLRWIIYPLAGLMILDFILRFFSNSPLDTNKQSFQLLEWLDQAIWIIVFVVVGVGVLALILQFFSALFRKDADAYEAAKAKRLIVINQPNQLAGSIILWVIALGFTIFGNLLLFAPDMILDEEVRSEIEFSEKIIFGFFYIIAHFLAIVFGLRLFKGMPPVFIATEKGFCYEPAGISSGWILWKDVVEVRESTVLYGSSVTNGPRTMPVLGIKLIDPETYNAKAFVPLLRKLVNVGQKFNNYQTEGVGDILIRPEDLGTNYDQVKAIFEQYTRKTIRL
ncbi:MAG: hypothetical protein K2Y12_08905 [Chitinophagaceae bacterium]|nr:hypothetical protein [Chitinophagaceae bacterium]